MQRIFASCFLAVCLSACDAGSETGAVSASAAGVPVYRVAAEVDIPFTVRGPNGTIDGFDKDLLEAIGRQQGFEVRFDLYSRTGMFEALADKKADITASGIYLNDERKARFGVTEPYMDSATVFLSREGREVQDGLTALAGKRLSVKAQTVAESLAKNTLGEGKFTAHTTLWMAFKDLVGDRADAVLGDEASLRHYAKQYPDEKLVLSDTLGRPKEQYVFLVRQDDAALLEKLNKGLAQARSDGTYQRLYDKWFEGTADKQGG